jgi:2',3'-cyclic-nucleotide 2'-phosphodiesterase (5'-nucleotidase family)
MGAMGYDATTIGNHEFDHTGVGFAEMLDTAKDAQRAAMRVLADSQLHSPLMQGYLEQYGPFTFVLPALLEANYVPTEDNPDREFIQQAMDNYGVQETMILERGGVTYGIFGLMGVDSHECAPTSGFELQEAAKAAERCVASLKEQGAEVIVCLSHAGTGDSLAFSEDEVLAENVTGSM